MTQQHQAAQPVGVDKAACAVRLSHPARVVHREILRGFAHTGRPPTPTDLQQATTTAGVDLAAALDELVRMDLVVPGPQGKVMAAYPFSATPTSHRLTLEGGTLVHAMCAIDALGVSAMLGEPVTVTSSEPGTDQPITVEVDGQQAAWDPATAVVLAGATADCCAPSAERTCGHIPSSPPVRRPAPGLLPTPSWPGPYWTSPQHWSARLPSSARSCTTTPQAHLALNVDARRRVGAA